MSRETWRLLTTWDADARFHMGFDEAQLHRGCEVPTLRFYTWRPDALSLGYFQPLADVQGIDRATEVVRRMTGGGAIHHTQELTFSITVPAGHRLYRGPVAESYVRVHAAIAKVLDEIGVSAALRGSDPASSDRTGTGMCFHASTPLDLVWDGRKGVGSAQRRRAEGILHHGSIKLAPSELEAGVATVEETSGDPWSPEAFGAQLAQTMAHEWGLDMRPGEPHADEVTEALERGQRFVSREMIERR